MDSRHEGNAAQQKFTFVDQTDRSREAFKAHKAVVRSHCMTEVRRQRRVKVTVEKESPSNVTSFMSEWNGKDSWQETHHLLPEGLDWASWNDHYSTKNTQAGIEDDLPTQLVNDDGDHARNETYGVQYASHLKAYSATRAEEEEQSNQNRGTSPSPTILGTSRVDPFRPLPITAGRDVYRLVDHYTITIPYLMYGTRSKNPVQHQLYNVATQDAAAFHSMLAFSARQHDSLSGSEASRNALAHSMQTLRLVYERVKDPAFKCEDGLVLAIALLAFAERRFGFDTTAQQHWLALREILKSRGGMESLQLNRYLAATLCWNCLVWSGTSTATTIEWHSIIASNKPISDVDASGEFEDFMAMLCISKAQFLDHARSCTSPSCAYSCTRRLTVFSRYGPLYALIAPTNPLSVSSYSTQRTARACQLPCLLYLAVVILEYATSPALLSYYLGRLMVCIYDDSLDMHVSAEHLLIKLLIGLEEGTNMLTRRAHQTIRMAAVVNGRGEKAREKVHGELLESLVAPEIGPGVVDELLEREADWEDV